MVGVDRALMVIDVVSKMLDGPLRDPVVLLMLLECTACICDLAGCSVFLLLGKHSPQAHARGVIFEQKWMAKLWVYQHRGFSLE